jgi:hypothetical protein
MRSSGPRAGRRLGEGNAATQFYHGNCWIGGCVAARGTSAYLATPELREAVKALW